MGSTDFVGSTDWPGALESAGVMALAWETGERRRSKAMTAATLMSETN
jgi:hypothetical protein